MEISAGQVKELREKTGAGMLDCKKALTESNGDFELAVEFLRKKGQASAAKKAGRTAADGSIVCMVDSTGSHGVVVEVNCETDFVARNEGFQSFLTDISTHILTNKPADMDALLAQTHKSGKKVADVLTDVVAKIGENIVLRRFQLVKVEGKGLLSSYIHAGGKIGVMVEVGTEADPKSDVIKTFAKDIAMHVAAAGPQLIRPDEVSPALVAKEKEIFLEQLKQDPKNANKPPQVMEKIIEGKIRKFTDDISLVCQPFVKNPELTVTQLMEETKKKAGGAVTIKRFVRFQLGEGVDKSAAN